jgi:hypothetical protein
MISNLKFMLTLACCLFGGLHLSALAETYLNFEAGETIRTAKTKYPNAHFSELKVGWTQHHEKFLEMSGQGIVGIVYLKFSNSDELYKTLRSQAADRLQSDPKVDIEAEQRMIQFYDEQLARPDEDRMGLDWIRWVPDTRLPIERIEGKYGKPGRCDYESDSFKPFCTWKDRGLTVSLSDDKRFVTMIDFMITDADWSKKFGIKSGKSEKKPDAGFELPSKNKKPKPVNLKSAM